MVRTTFLVANEGVEEVELTAPWEAVEELGASCELLAPKRGTVQAFNHLDRGERFDVDRLIEDASVDDYDILVLPGGVANPDQLRTNGDAVRFVREFVEAGKPVAAICHGPWTLIEAGVVGGRVLTSWPSLQTDVRNAGAEWIDSQLVDDRNGPGPIISSRNPADLPAFCDALSQLVAERSASPSLTR